MKLNGYFIPDNGTLEKCEIFGPPTFDAWSKAYKVLQTVLVMIGAVLPAQLDRYHDFVQAFAYTCGSRPAG